MNRTKTLSQICRQLGITRKTVQGYEKLGLIRSCGKTSGNRLLYDEENQNGIIGIHFFQKLGFSREEAGKLLADDQRSQICALEIMIKDTRNRIDSMEERIRIMEMILGKLKDGSEIEMICLHAMNKEDKTE